jgi:predicted phosphoribosyltransferase
MRKGQVMTGKFRNRREAGRVLAKKLQRYADGSKLVVLALPRGGVPVAYEVAEKLHAPLDVFVVRKLGYPGHEEFAMGAIASGGTRVVNPDLEGRVSSSLIEETAEREIPELERRERLYRGDRPPLSVRGKTVILVDDGIATGSTMRAAVQALRKQGPDRIVIGVPVSSPSTCEELGADVEDVVCAVMPEPFYAVGLWYQEFEQTTDEEVQELLRIAHEAEFGTPRERSITEVAHDTR